MSDNITKEERESLKEWQSNQLFNPEGNLVMRLQDKGNRFILVDKTTDKQKAMEQIDRSSFIKLDSDPTQEHIKKVSKWCEKWLKRGDLSADWSKFIINATAQPGKNSTLYKTHKENNPVRLLTTGCNTAIENLSRYIESVCAPLTENFKSRIKNTSHLLDIVDELNENGLPDGVILVSFDIVNMFRVLIIKKV